MCPAALDSLMMEWRRYTARLDPVCRIFVVWVVLKDKLGKKRTGKREIEVMDHKI